MIIKWIITLVPTRVGLMIVGMILKDSPWIFFKWTHLWETKNGIYIDQY
jgi:hypothetical protein